MLKIVSVLVTTFCLVLLFSRCAYHTKQVPVTPSDTTAKACDTLPPVKYANVEVIFTDNNCISCHETGVSGPKLKDYDTFKTYITSNEAAFLAAINFQNSTVKNMPQGGLKMSDAEINKITTWICQGMNP